MSNKHSPRLGKVNKPAGEPLYHEDIRIFFNTCAVPKGWHYVLQIVGMCHSNGPIILISWSTKSSLSNVVRAHIVDGGPLPCQFDESMDSMAQDTVRKYLTKLIHIILIDL